MFLCGHNYIFENSVEEKERDKFLKARKRREVCSHVKHVEEMGRTGAGLHVGICLMTPA